MTVEATSDALKINYQPLKKQQNGFRDPVNKDCAKDIRDKLHTGTLAILVRRYKTMGKSLSYVDSPWEKCQWVTGDQCKIQSGAKVT